MSKNGHCYTRKGAKYDLCNTPRGKAHEGAHRSPKARKPTERGEGFRGGNNLCRDKRSGLLYEVQRLLLVAYENGTTPKYLILENVKNLVGKKFKEQFFAWVQWLGNLGYNTYWKVINAADCGIPQNRERVFAVSIRKDIDTGFSFPQPIPLKVDFFDLLQDETEVDEKYYLSDAFIEYAENQTVKMTKAGNGFKFEPVEREQL